MNSNNIAIDLIITLYYLILNSCRQYYFNQNVKTKE